MQADLLFKVLDIPQWVLLKPPQPERLQVHPMRLPVQRQVRQYPPHHRAHLEPVPRKPRPDHHIPPKLPSKEVNHIVPIRGHRIHTRLRRHRLLRLHPPPKPPLDPRADRLLNRLHIMGPGPPIRIAGVPAVERHLDQPRELQRRRTVYIRLAVAREGWKTRLRREFALETLSDPPVTDSSVNGLNGKPKPSNRFNQLPRPGPNGHHALLSQEVIPTVGFNTYDLIQPFDLRDLHVVLQNRAVFDGEGQKHGLGLGGLDDPAKFGDNPDPVIGYGKETREAFGELVGFEDPIREGRGFAVGDDGEEALVVGWAEVEVVGLGEGREADVGMGLGPETGRVEDEREVVGFGVGGADGAGLAVGGAEVVEEVEPLNEEHRTASFRDLVSRAAPDDARPHHDRVEDSVIGRLRFHHPLFFFFFFLCSVAHCE
ncbi:hypothetical protein QJS04_geneDACA004090 [Acorus gramineus]|uniref:Uncharacterized protein n=1 Tax=Acorus gramineus TaxID=55184 RepID=A0AAV9BF18_ACOGR|nr:hypothetical protein QJS04_geneDACA004090 [Acorus gramineus]